MSTRAVRQDQDCRFVIERASRIRTHARTRRAEELAEVLESARRPGKHRSMHSAFTSQLGGHPFFSDTCHLSEQGMRAFCDTYLASLAEAWLLCEKPPVVWVHRLARGLRRNRVRLDALRRGQGQGRKC